jgi:hypothetical protein
MAKQVKRRRGTASEHAVFTTGAHGEITVSLPDDPVQAADKTSNPAEIYVHYGDSAVGERFLSRTATIDLIREQLDRQVFLARITGSTAINTGDTGFSADSGTNENRWMYEWEEVAIHTPIAQQVKLEFTFNTSGSWSTTDVTTTFKLPVIQYGTHAPGENQATSPTTSPAYDSNLVDFSLKLTHGQTGSIDSSSIGTFIDNWVAAWNAIPASSSATTSAANNGRGEVTSGTSTVRFHTATKETSTNKVILTKIVPENVVHEDAEYNSSGLAVSGGTDVTAVAMTVVSGTFDRQQTGAGKYDTGTPDLNGLFMQYGATSQTPAINSTPNRNWTSVDPSDGGTGDGYFYALNTAEMSNFYVESEGGSATEGYGVIGAGMSTTDANNTISGLDTAIMKTVVSQKPSTDSTSTSRLYAKRTFPQGYSIDPIAVGTIVVMHERWSASTSGEANYSGLFPPGGRGVAATYSGTAVGDSPSTGDETSGTMYTPAPPYYYFSMPNVTQGSCG